MLRIPTFLVPLSLRIPTFLIRLLLIIPTFLIPLLAQIRSSGKTPEMGMTEGYDGRV